jgi:hypothetical protein
MGGSAGSLLSCGHLQPLEMPLTLHPPRPPRHPDPSSVLSPHRIEDARLWHGAVVGAIYAANAWVLLLLSAMPAWHAPAPHGRAADLLGRITAVPLLFAILGGLAGVASAHCLERYASALAILRRPVMARWLMGGYAFGALCGARQLLVLWYQSSLPGAPAHTYLTALGVSTWLGGWWSSASLLLAGALAGGVFAVLFGWTITYVEDSVTGRATSSPVPEGAHDDLLSTDVSPD